MSNNQKKWRKNYYERAKPYTREHIQQNEKRMIEKRKIGHYTNPNCRIIHNLGRRIYRAVKGIVKTSSTVDLLGIDFKICIKWINFQTCPDVNWSNIHIDHFKPFCSVEYPKLMDCQKHSIRKPVKIH